MRGLIGLTIGPLLGAVLASVPLSAQERPTELSGCYDIAADSLEVGSGSGYESELPPRIEFTGPYRGFGEPDTSRTQIVVPEGALPSVHSLTWGQIVGDSLNLVFSTGFGGVKAMLGWAGDRWVGGARTFRDFGPPFEFDAGSIELVPANCDTPPPVSVDAMLPVARSVELEGRLVITLGEPLPAALGTTPKRFANKSVTGRTTGLFAGTDSIAVGVVERWGVTQVRLYYNDPGAYSMLETRFRSAYGDPETDPDWGRFVFRNPITSLTLSNWGHGGALVILSGRY